MRNGGEGERRANMDSVGLQEGKIIQILPSAVLFYPYKKILWDKYLFTGKNACVRVWISSSLKYPDITENIFFPSLERKGFGKVQPKLQAFRAKNKRKIKPKFRGPILIWEMTL